MTDTVLWLNEAAVADLVGLAEAIDQVALCLADEHRGAAESIAKTFGTWDRSSAHALGAVSTARRLTCFKTWVNTPDGAAALLNLFSSEDGRALATFEAGTLGFLRTAAINGVATDRLAATDARSMAVVGSGRQALPQVAAVHQVRPLESVRVFSPTAAHREAFATRITADLGIEATAAGSLEEALDGQPIVTSITRATDPFLAAGMLAEGAHLNAAGAILPSKAELLPDLLEQSSLTVVDNVANARGASRELIELDSWDRVVPLHAVVAGEVERPPAPRLTAFKGMGMGLSDLALASFAYHRALELGVGEPMPHAAPSAPMKLREPRP